MESKIKTILIVDDNKLILDMLYERLNATIDNINILQATSFKEALKFILDKTITIHAAIIDLHLPDCQDGAVVDYTLKKHIPTIVLTGSESEDIKQQMMQKNIIDYIVKSDIRAFLFVINTIHRIIKNYDLNVLIVDDSVLQLKAAYDLLHKMKLNITTAKDGLEAYNILKQNNKKYSLLLTDYNMPNMDGLELTSKVRELYHQDELSIIVLSANGKADLASKFIKLGANDFLNKPYNEVEVTTRINSNLNILELFQQTKDMANKDFLTGAYNRRYFFESGNQIFKKALRDKRELCVAMFDIDKFKNINDTYGHDIGDEAIKNLCDILNSNLRDSDLMARFGGEEFCVLLENITLENTKLLFEKIRKVFEDNILEVYEYKLNYTVSIGICYGLEENLELMIKKADDGLYYCKEHGRNQIAINV